MSMKNDQEKEENADVELLEKKVELKQKQEGEEFVILQELANKEESFANDTPTANPYPIDSELPVTSQGWFEGGPLFSEEVEAKGEVQEAASINCKSDGDSSSGQVLHGKLGGEIADNSDQKKTDELEEAGEEKEDEIRCSDNQEQLHEWKQREEERAEELHELQRTREELEEVAEQLRGYQEMFQRDLAEEQKEKHEAARKQYKEHLSELLGVVYKSKAKLDASNEQLDIWNEEYLYSKLDGSNKELENYKVIKNVFALERLEWNEEKEHLHSKLEHATELLQQERLKWEEEKGQLLKQWDEEKKALLAMQHINSITRFDKLTKERDDLAARVADEKSMVESYKGLYDQSEEHCQYYKACFEEYEQKYLKLKEENLNISAKLFTETSFAERYKKIVNELEDKCRRLEEEKNDVNAKLCAAKASSELYRSCLLDSF
ncbi:hypothetical protein CCACVL1_16638 [Corchorus capsularis]|uniref:Uncharacterized protein n=1 Tax=Corchorus capsularis TaxID=210143 RepID=A0A1R3HVY7_COCAP|nr:hypothetical protein CCACVL1_16638 [Corchorus capsularis]